MAKPSLLRRYGFATAAAGVLCQRSMNDEGAIRLR